MVVNTSKHCVKAEDHFYLYPMSILNFLPLLLNGDTVSSYSDHGTEVTTSWLTVDAVTGDVKAQATYFAYSQQ